MRYCEQLHSDVKAMLLPKCTALFKKVERVHLESVDDEAVLLALAKSLHNFEEEYDELHVWFVKMKPKKLPDTKKQRTAA